jgi:hypothetical protein
MITEEQMAAQAGASPQNQKAYATVIGLGVETYGLISPNNGFFAEWRCRLKMAKMVRAAEFSPVS